MLLLLLARRHRRVAEEERKTKLRPSSSPPVLFSSAEVEPTTSSMRWERELGARSRTTSTASERLSDTDHGLYFLPPNRYNTISPPSSPSSSSRPPTESLKGTCTKTKANDISSSIRETYLRRAKKGSSRRRRTYLARR